MQDSRQPATRPAPYLRSFAQQPGRPAPYLQAAHFQPVPYLNTYASTKAFVLSYTRSLGQELKPRGIRVMAANPGWVKTEFFDHALQTSDKAVTYYNKVYEAKDVIATALRDLYKSKKDVSIHGLRIRSQVRLVKLLPHSIVMKIWMKQQGHHNLPDED